MTERASSLIAPLTSWRGIFVLCIAWFHCGVMPVCMQLTMAGVVCFFIMSGFLTCRAHRGLQGRGLGRFLASRALRLYPAHWLSLALFTAFTVAVHEKGLYWPALLPNALLVQCFIPVRDYFFSFNVPSWFLSSLLACYLCYGLLYRGLKAMPLKWQLATAAALMVPYAIAMGSIESKSELAWAYVCPLLRVYEFALGMVMCNVGHAVGHRWDARRGHWAEWVPVGLTALLTAIDVCWPQLLGARYDQSIIWEIPMALLVLVHALNNDNPGPVGRALSWRPLVWLGSMSLELFLLQGLAGRLYNYLVAPVLGHYGIEAYAMVPVGMLPLLVGGAWLMHRYFTRPVQAWAAAKLQG